MVQRTLPGLLLGLVAAAATAQVQDDLRWRSGTGQPGLAPQRAPLQVACGTVAFPCDGAAALRLYTAPRMARSLELQFATLGLPRDVRFSPAPAQGLNVSVLGRATVLGDFGVYGRVGTLLGRPVPAPGGAAEGGYGLSFGAGLRWDFSPRASAVLGWDSHDLNLGGDGEPVRSTSLGLQWRY